MAKVRLTSDEWGDFVATFLLDAAVHDDVLEGNDEFRELMHQIKSKLKPQLLKYYLNLDANMRTNYRRVRKGLVGETEQQTDILVKGKPTKFPAV
jgi:hypothetical protein